MEDHSWHNKVIFYDIFNLNQNSTYEAATAIAVLGYSCIHSKFCPPKQYTISFNKYIHLHVYMQYQNSNHLQLHTLMYAVIWLSPFQLLKFTTS